MSRPHGRSAHETRNPSRRHGDDRTRCRSNAPAPADARPCFQAAARLADHVAARCRHSTSRRRREADGHVRPPAPLSHVGAGVAVDRLRQRIARQVDRAGTPGVVVGRQRLDTRRRRRACG